MQSSVHALRLVVLALLTSLGSAQVAPRKLYWTDAHTSSPSIRRCDLDGSATEMLLGGLSQPRGLVIDHVRSRMYWQDQGGQQLRSARLDGTDVRLILTVPTSFCAGPAIDESAGKLYWCQGDVTGNQDAVLCANLDGSSQQVVVGAGLSLPAGIALDLVNGKVIWSDIGTHTIQRSNLDGTMIETIVPNTHGDVYGLTVEPSGGKLYWAALPPPAGLQNGSICRSALDGTSVEVLFAGAQSPTVVLPDPVNAAVFWTESLQGISSAIKRGDLTTGVVSTVTGLGVPWGLAEGSLLVYPFCAGDGLDPTVTISCPCGNVGASHHGCANSAVSDGALLGAIGTSSPDTIQLLGSGMPANAACLYVQGDQSDSAGLVFGDGIRCIDGSLIRLRLMTNVGGASSYPQPGMPSVSARGGVVPGSGSIRYYQTYYRNPAAAFCPPSTFNMTNGVVVVW